MSLTKENLMPKDALSKRILEERAAHLAQIPKQEEDRKTIPYILFRLGENEHYGIPYEFITEVIENINITPIPFVPDFIAGTTNRHGKLVAIIDLKRFFKMHQENQKEKCSFIILVEADQMTIGIIADNIEGIDSFDPITLEASLQFSGFIKAEFLLGLHKGLIAIINTPAILADLQLQIGKSE